MNLGLDLGTYQMTELIRSKLNLRVKSKSFMGYTNCVDDLLQSEITNTMDGCIQHGSVTCLEHSLSVSYYSYILCRLLHLDYRSAARGGLLHDLFLYNWRKSKLTGGMHSFTHPYTALLNANKYFLLNKMEKDIIVKHMWPLTIKLPIYRESYVVSFVDKYCAIVEGVKFLRIKMFEYADSSLSEIW